MERAVQPAPHESAEENLRREHEAYEQRAETPEYLRENVAHFERIHETGTRHIQDYLRVFAREGDSAAIRQIETIDSLMEGQIVPTRQPLQKPGRNLSVEPCVVETGTGSTFAFKKTLFCGAQFFLDPETNQFFRVRSSYEDGDLSRTLEPVDPEEGCGLTLTEVISSINGFKPYIRCLSDIYGIDASRLRILENPLAVIPADSRHESGSAVATYWMKALMFPKNPGVVPETVYRNANGTPVTLQRGVGRTGIDRETISNFYRTGSAHPLAEPLARIAAVHFGCKETDGKLHNAAILPTTMFSIDNGGGYLHSVRKGNAYEPYVFQHGLKQTSFAWEIARDIGAKLPDSDIRHLKTIIADYNTYCQIVRGRIPPHEAEQYPDHVKNGLVAKLLYSIVQLAYERVDEDGNVIPETRIAAQKELAFLVARIDHLATHGCPPDDDRFIDIYGYKSKCGRTGPPPVPKRRPPPPSQRANGPEA
jgi:hypothetical protein